MNHQINSDVCKGSGGARKNSTRTTTPSKYGAVSPYVNYLQSAEIILDTNYASNDPSQTIGATDAMTNHPYFMGNLVDVTEGVHMRRPKTSIQTFDSISKSIK